MFIIQTVFTGRGKTRWKHRFFQKRWIRKRIEIFKKYTLASLLNQTDRDFLHWISFRPEDRKNNDVNKFKEYLYGLNYRFVFTFNGQPYWDDKGDNSDLNRRVAKDMRVLRGFVDKKVYLLVLDSDDCLHSKMVENVKRRVFEGGKALVVKNGYVFNGKGLREWNPTTNPPFYTIMFDNFTNVKNYVKTWKGFRSHEDVTKIFKTECLPDGMYLVTTHGSNKTTNWKTPWGKRHPFIGKKINKEKLKCFGIS